jgi:hypothetical protein
MTYFCIALVIALIVQSILHARERREGDRAQRLLIARADGKPMRDPDRPAPTPSPRPVSLGDDHKIVALQKGSVSGGEGI